jgi:hypothetical protein
MFALFKGLFAVFINDFIQYLVRRLEHIIVSAFVFMPTLLAQ